MVSWLYERERWFVYIKENNKRERESWCVVEESKLLLLGVW